MQTSLGRGDSLFFSEILFQICMLFLFS